MSVRGAVAMLVGVFFLAMPAAAFAAPSAADIKAACAPGTDPQPAGSAWTGGLNAQFGALTPVTLAGAQLISAGEARCVLTRFDKGVTVLAALDDKQILPQSISIGWAASASEDVSIQQSLERVAAAASGGDKAHPFIVYCHHERCFMSYNVALRLVRAGYRAVYWMRTGLSEWTKAGYPMVDSRDPSLLTVRGRATADFVKSLSSCERGPFDAERVGKMKDWYVRSKVLDDSAVEAYKKLAEVTGQSTNPRADFLKDIEKDNGYTEQCMLRRRATTEPSYVAEYGSAVASSRSRWARSEAQLVADYRAIADWFDADPNTALHPASLKAALDPGILAATLATVRSVPPLSASCETVNTSGAASHTEEELKRRIAIANQRLACVAKWMKDVPAIELPNDRGFMLAANWVKRSRPYLCSIRKQVNCLPDADWQRIAAIATEANSNLVVDVSQTATKNTRESWLGAEYGLLGNERRTLVYWASRAGSYENGKFVSSPY